MVSLRNLKKNDLQAVCEIEKLAHISPWSMNALQACLEDGYHCRVLTDCDGIIGYYIILLVVDECHILNVAIHPNQQGKGYSHDLMHDMFHQLDAQSNAVKKVFLEVRKSNHIAQSLYEKWGFGALSIRRGYYRNGNNKEDALILVRSL